MFLPIGDYPNPRRAQWVTRILIALNVAIYLFVSLPLGRQPVERRDLAQPEAHDVLAALAADQGFDYEEARPDERYAWVRGQRLSRYDLFVMIHGYKPGRPSLLDLLVCMFLHGGFMHLFGNMLFLWIYGDNVEARMGTLGYLAGYLATGALATLTFAALNPGSLVPLVGASGAISGVLGFYLLWFPHNRVKVFLWWFYFIDVLHIRAVWFLIFYVLLFQNLLPIAAGGGAGGGGVAHWAHVGGFAAGVAGAFLVDAVFGKRPAPHPDVPTRRRMRPDEMRTAYAKVVEDTASTFSAALEAGRMEDAAYAFARLAREGGRPPPPAHVFRLANWLYENGFARDAAAVFRFYLKSFPRGEDLDRVHLGLGMLLSRRMGQAVAARQHLLAALDLAPDGSVVAAHARSELARIGG